MRKNSYSTKQGSLVLSCFEEHSSSHLTIEDISDILSKNSTPVGIATIYRHVQKLEEQGKIRKYSVEASDSACYQYIQNGECKQHFHLKCTVCSKLFHASCPFLEEISTHIHQHHGFAVDNSRTVFYGVCQECLRNSKKS